MQFRTIITIITLIAITKVGFAQYSIERKECFTIEELKDNAAIDTIAVSSIDHFFFHYGLKNKDLLKGKCRLLFETDRYFYYGYGLIPKKGEVGSCYYYKIPKNEVLDKLPKYEELSYYLVDSVAQPYWTKINERYQKDKKERKQDFDIIELGTSLSGEHIHMNRLYKIKHHIWGNVLEEKKHTAIIDKNSFELISK